MPARQTLLLPQECAYQQTLRRVPLSPTTALCIVLWAKFLISELLFDAGLAFADTPQRPHACRQSHAKTLRQTSLKHACTSTNVLTVLRQAQTLQVSIYSVSFLPSQHLIIPP